MKWLPAQGFLHVLLLFAHALSDRSSLTLLGQDLPLVKTVAARVNTQRLSFVAAAKMIL